MQIRVVDLHASRRLDIAGGDNARAFLAQVHNNRLIGVGRKHHALDVQNDLGNVFLHTVDGGELVENTIDLDGGYRCTRNGGQQGTTQRVTEGVAKARLERFDDELGTRRVDEFLGELRTLGNEH